MLQHSALKPEDMDTTGEDHAADDWRYACMARPWIKMTFAPEPPKDGYRELAEPIRQDSWKTM